MILIIAVIGENTDHGLKTLIVFSQTSI